MVMWSCLRRAYALNATQNLSLKNLSVLNGVLPVQRCMSGGHGPRLMPIQPSRWQWHKFKDLFHYYLMVGLIPVGAIVFYCNVFIGPAQLAEIPEGYTPKHWEYHQHPITRFLAKYWFPSHQQEYEKLLHFVHEEEEIRQIRKLEKKIKGLMAERLDYQAYYYRPMVAKYWRIAKQTHEELEALQGDN